MMLIMIMMMSSRMNDRDASSVTVIKIVGTISAVIVMSFDPVGGKD